MSGARDFWSRRRAAVAAEDAAATADAAATGAGPAGAAERPDAEILAELDLPDPETLTIGDEIAGFLGRAVPEHLRRRALRRHWRLNPVLANLDGMVDYGEDYTDAARVVAGMKTTYQVGKGMLAHLEKLAADAARAENPPPAPPEPDIPVASAGDSPEPVADAAFVPATAAAPAPEPADETARPMPRRMRFAFEG